MLDRCYQKLLLFGCLACLAVTVSADGRVFVLDLRNSSGLQGFRDAEQACASQHGRLASVEELHHAVVECFFSPCTRGWLYGGSVGTTVCNVVGSVLKAVDVRIENATEDAAHLNAFCIKDKDEPCGDPPSFPNTRLQSHSGSEIGDELLYTCVPGYVMASGYTAFSLLCDSCGEWYGMVQSCVNGETESRIDYEDTFTDSYVEIERNHEKPAEAHGDVQEEQYGAAYPHGDRSPEQQVISFRIKAGEEHQEQHREHEVGGEVTDHGRPFEGAAGEGEKNEERAVEDFVGHRMWEQDSTEVVKTDAMETTEAPVSLLSQKHMFWFPSEAFQGEGPQVSTNPVTQTTQRASGARSEESKEHESQEMPYQHPVDIDNSDHEQDDFDDHDTSHYNDKDGIHEISHHDDHDDGDSRHDEDHEDHERQPVHNEDLDGRESHEHYDDHDEHYDMGEHEEDHEHISLGNKEYDDQDDTYDGLKSHEDHVTDDHDDHDDRDREHPDASEEHPDHDDHDDAEEHYDDNDYADDHDDRERKDGEKYDDHDSREDDDHRQYVIFSVAADEHQNVTQGGAGRKPTTDDTWLDGYPVVPENGDSTTEKVRSNRERGRFVKTTDRPNEVEIRGPARYTTSPKERESPTLVPESKQEVVEKVHPDSIRTPAFSSDHLLPSGSPSYSKTGEYDTQQAVPTHSWMGDLTEHPFLDHGPAPPVLILPGETGEREELEGEMGETICVDEDCPPHPPSSSSRGPTVAAIIVAICAVATAVIAAVWCYRRQQQKSSVYDMNGKGQSQTRQGQQIEMQQKV